MSRDTYRLAFGWAWILLGNLILAVHHLVGGIQNPTVLAFLCCATGSILLMQGGGE